MTKIRIHNRPNTVTEPKWWEEVRCLLAQGYLPHAIAKRVRQKEATVREFISDGCTSVAVDGDEEFYEPHVYRKPRRVIKPPAEVMTEARRFASGQIDRQALMQSIAA